MTKPSQPDLPVIGWREWVALPQLKIRRIKAKVDSGARSSSLHASQLEQFEQSGDTYVRFHVHPYHRYPEKSIVAEAKVIDVRTVRSSSGETSDRPVIVTNVALMGLVLPVELTLANRDEMGFRMLLGREAFRGKFLVDAGNSYFNGRLIRKKSDRPKPKSNH